MVYLNQLSFQNIQSFLSKSKHAFTKVVAYQPTGWTHKGSGSSLLSSREKGNICIYSAAYSEHSSFSELVEFIQIFRPQMVIPTVSTSKSKDQIEILKKHSKSVYAVSDEKVREFVSEF